MKCTKSAMWVIGTVVAGSLPMAHAGQGDEQGMARRHPGTAVRPFSGVWQASTPVVLRPDGPLFLVGPGVVPTAGMSPVNRVLAAATSIMAHTSAPVDQEDSQAWVGVILSPVPAPLARHLGLHDQGIMVMNVAEGSPAQQAAIEQFDVIVEIAGAAVSGDFAAFAEQVRSHVPGESIDMKIIRSGEPMNVRVILAERPVEPGKIAYVYESQPRNIVSQELKGVGKIIEKDEDGNWVIRDLGELEDFGPLMLDMPELKELGRSFKAFGSDRSSNVRIRSRDDGQSLQIDCDRNGDDVSITVRRTREVNGVEQTEEKQYSSEDELREDDPEAYEQLKGSGGAGIGFRYHFDLDDLDLPDFQKEWAFEIQRSLKENQELWQDAMKKAMEAYQEALPQLQDAQRQLGQAQKWLGALKADPGGKWHSLRSLPHAARVSITERPDGQIQVTTRRGDSELIRVYRDEDELRERDPHAFEEYQRLLEAPLEEE